MWRRLDTRAAGAARCPELDGQCAAGSVAVAATGCRLYTACSTLRRWDGNNGQNLQGAAGTAQQDREPLLRGGPDRRHAAGSRSGDGAAEGGPQGPRTVPRSGGDGRAPGGEGKGEHRAAGVADQGASEGGQPRRRGAARDPAAESADRSRLERAAAADARTGVPEQPAQDP